MFTNLAIERGPHIVGNPLQEDKAERIGTPPVSGIKAQVINVMYLPGGISGHELQSRGVVGTGRVPVPWWVGGQGVEKLQKFNPYGYNIPMD